MRPTRPSGLLLTGLAAAVLAFLLARLAYGDLPPLPAFAPVPLLLLGLGELLLARAVSRRLRGPAPGGRVLHPLQVARAAVLAKASSAGGALLVGGYAGLLVHVLTLQAEQARADARVAAVSLAAGLLLVVAALLLERSCRTPDGPDDPYGREDAAVRPRG